MALDPFAEFDGIDQEDPFAEFDEVGGPTPPSPYSPTPDSPPTEKDPFAEFAGTPQDQGVGPLFPDDQTATDPFFAPEAEAGSFEPISRLSDAAIDLLGKGPVAIESSLAGLGRMLDVTKTVGYLMDKAGEFAGNKPGSTNYRRGLVDTILDETGHDPQKAMDWWTTMYSDERIGEEAKLEAAKGVVDTLKVLATEPAVAIGKGLESAPGMITIMGTARKVAGKVAVEAEKQLIKRGITDPKVIADIVTKQANKWAIRAAAGTEGVQQTGSSFEELEKSGVEDTRNYIASLGSGAITALTSLVMGKAGQKFGLGDVEAGLAGKGGIPARIGKGGVQEGLLEEGLQSPQEQAWSNWAKREDIKSGLGKAWAIGATTGFISGGAFSIAGQGDIQPKESQITKEQAFDNILLANSEDEIRSSFSQLNEEDQQWVKDQFDKTIQDGEEKFEVKPESVKEAIERNTGIAREPAPSAEESMEVLGEIPVSEEESTEIQAKARREESGDTFTSPEYEAQQKQIKEKEEAAAKKVADEKQAAETATAKEEAEKKATFEKEYQADLEAHEERLTRIPKEEHIRMKKEAQKEAVQADPVQGQMDDLRKSPISIWSFKADFDKNTLSDIPNHQRLFTNAGTRKIDEVASELGYESDGAMLEAFKTAGSKKDAIDRIFKEKVAEWDQAEAQMQEAEKAEAADQATVKKEDVGAAVVSPETAQEPSAEIKEKPADTSFDFGPNVEKIEKTESVASGQAVNLDPSEAQKEKGNYKKAHANMDGLGITIENPIGTTRKWVDDAGREGKQTFNSDYGYIKSTVGFDKDHVDVFIKPGYEGNGETVYVVNQHNKDGSFDETKVVMGAASEQEAMDLYNSNYEKGWDRGESIVAMPTEEFKEWVKSDAPSKGPAETTEKTERRDLAEDGKRKERRTEAPTGIKIEIKSERNKPLERELDRAARTKRMIESLPAEVRAELEKRLEDELLGTYGVTDFSDARIFMEHLQAKGIPFTLLRSDGGNLGGFNKKHGGVHAKADKDLRKIWGEIYVRGIRELGGVIARDQGDEFIEIIPNYTLEEIKGPRAEIDKQIRAKRDGMGYADTMHDKKSLPTGAGHINYGAVYVTPTDNITKLEEVADKLQQTQKNAELEKIAKETGHAYDEKTEKYYKVDKGVSEADSIDKIGGKKDERQELEQETRTTGEGGELGAAELLGEGQEPTGEGRSPEGVEAGTEGRRVPPVEEEPTEQRPAEPEKPAKKKAAKKKTTLPGIEEKPDQTEDVGKELVYNKRNWVKSGIDWSDIKDQDVALRVKQVTKAKVYPRPDYQAMIDSGMQPVVAHIIKQAYDSLAAKPRTSGVPTDEQLEQYIKAVNNFMDGVLSWASNKDEVLDWITKISQSAKVQAGVSAGKPTDISDMMRKEPEPGKGLLESVFPGGWRAHNSDLGIIGGNKTLQAIQPYTGEAVKAFKDIAKGWPKPQESWAKRGFKVIHADNIRIEYYSGESSTGRKYTYVLVHQGSDRIMSHSIDEAESKSAPAVVKFADEITKELTDKFLLVDKRNNLIDAFDSKDAAVEGAREHVKPSKKKKRVSEKGISVALAKRTGPPTRKEGENISSKKLMDTFKFKGINFGNWMKGKSNETERQLHINHAYDSFHDLAELLNVPPEAMSLNGLIGVAFGAQGKGGAAAHFVPGFNEINLTRESGAGSLAHEWAHALDHHFGRQAGLERDSDPFLSSTLPYNTHRHKDAPIRKDIVDKFQTIVQAMTKRDITPEERKADNEAYQKRVKKNVDSWLKGIKSRYLSQATEGLTVQIDGKDVPFVDAVGSLVKRIEEGDYGDGKVVVRKGRTSYEIDTSFHPAVLELRDLHKKAFGRVYPIADFKALQSNIDSLVYRKENKDQASDHIPQVASEYLKSAQALDKETGKKQDGKGYWSQKLEMFARAFDAYVSDTLEGKEIKNTYLSHFGKMDETVPKDKEREAINKAFDELLAEIKYRKTEAGGELYAKGKPSTATKSTVADLTEAVDKLLTAKGRENLNVEVVQGVDDLMDNLGIGAKFSKDDTNWEKSESGKLFGYKVMAIDENGQLRSGADSRLRFPNKTGETIAMPGYGVFLSNKPQYVLDYYSSGEGNEALLKLEFDPADIKFGESQLNDREPEIGLSSVTIVETTKIDTDDISFSADGTIQGAFDPKTGNIHLVADNISTDEAWSFVLHEGVHKVKSDKGWAGVFGKRSAGIMKSIDAKIQANDQAWKEAEQKAIDAGTPESDLREETITYFIAAKANQKQSLYRRIVNAIRAWAVNIGLTREITDKDIVALAEASIQRTARKTEAVAVPSGELTPAFAKKGFKPVDTDSPEFKKWFGDSKVVNENGDPLVVYHGTGTEFDAFNPKEIGKMFGVDEEGFFFTTNTIHSVVNLGKGKEKSFEDPYSAGAYARNAADMEGAGAQIVPVHLSIKNPLTADDVADNFYLDRDDPFYGDPPQDFFDDNKKEIMAMAKEGGHDGIILDDGKDNIFVAFSPTQIKSAISNTGEFSAEDPRIMFAKGPAKEKIFSEKDVKKGEDLINQIIATMKKQGRFDKDLVRTRIKKYEGKIKALKAIAKDNTLDVTARQKQVRDTLKELPMHVRGRAINEIVKVGEFKTPQGRERAVNRAMGRIVTLLDQYYVSQGIKDVDKKIKDAKKAVRKKRGITTARTTPETLKQIYKIKEIREMTFDEIGARLDEIIADDQTTEPSDEQIEEMALLNTFGNLREKTSEEVAAALEQLQNVIDEGKFIWQQMTADQKARRKDLANMAVEVIRGDQPELAETDKGTDRSFMAEIIGEFSDKSQNWQWLMDKLSRFDRESGVLRSRLSKHFARAVHAATHRQNRGELEQEHIIKAKIEEIYGLKGRKLSSQLSKNETIIEKKSGVNLYGENGEVKTKNLRISQNMAYKKWQEWHNPLLREDLIRQGVTQQTMDEIDEFMRPEVKKWAEWQIKEFYVDYYDDINDVFRALTFTDMPRSEDYVPIRRVYHKGRDQEMNIDGYASYHGSMVKGSHKMRVRNNLDIAFMDGDVTLSQHIAEMEHFKAWALVVRDMRSVFGSPKVRKAIKDHHGRKAMQTVDIFIEDFVRGGVEARNNIAVLDAIRSLWVKTKLAGNLVVFIKQLTSIPAYAIEIPIHSFMLGFTKAIVNPRRAARILMDSTMMQARYEKNQIDRDMKFATQKRPAKQFAGTKKLSDKAMFTTRMGDKAAIILGGYAVYDYHRKKQLKKHGDKERAHKESLIEFEMVTENTQQATGRKDLSVYQTGDSIQKGMTMFMTALSSYARMWEGGFRNLKIPGIKKGRGSQITNLKRLFYAQIVLPTLFQLAASGFEWDPEKQRRARWLGPLNGLFIVRDLMAGVYDIIFLGKAWGLSAQPQLEEVHDLMVKIVSGDLDLEDMANMINASRVVTGTMAAVKGETEHPIRRILGYSEKTLNPTETSYQKYKNEENKIIRRWKEDRTRKKPSIKLKSIKKQITAARKAGNKKQEQRLKERFVEAAKKRR